jgi:hypothetical protein
MEVDAAPESWTPDQPPAPQLADNATFLRLRHVTFVEMVAAKGIQWLISAIGLAIVGYLLFSDKFVGTGPELMTAFFWGFTTDVGLDALVSAAKPKSAA